MGPAALTRAAAVAHRACRGPQRRRPGVVSIRVPSDESAEHGEPERRVRPVLRHRTRGSIVTAEFIVRGDYLPGLIPLAVAQASGPDSPKALVWGVDLGDERSRHAAQKRLRRVCQEVGAYSSVHPRLAHLFVVYTMGARCPKAVPRCGGAGRHPAPRRIRAHPRPGHRRGHTPCHRLGGRRASSGTASSRPSRAATVRAATPRSDGTTSSTRRSTRPR